MELNSNMVLQKQATFIFSWCVSASEMRIEILVKISKYGVATASLRNESTALVVCVSVCCLNSLDKCSSNW